MANDFKRLYIYDYTEKMKEMISQSSIIKQEIFKNNIMGNEISYVKINAYVNFINDFLKYWEDYGKDTQSKMSKSSGVEGIRNIKYQDIRDYIYSNYDYAVIIPFIDNIYNQFDNKSLDKDSIVDYFTTTISKAFDGQPPTVAGLIDLISSNDSILMDYSFRTDKYESKLFDSVKNYRKMFPESDRIMLFKAVQKAVDYISRKKSVVISKGDTQIFITLINYVIEMITYSTIAYASRIFIICHYGYNFIDANKSDTMIPVEESTTLSNSIQYEDMRFLADASEVTFSKVENAKEAFEIVRNFITALGIGVSDLDIRFGSYESIPKLCSGNKFIEKLKESNNLLFMVLDDYRFMEIYEGRLKCIEENIQQLKSILYNDKQGNSITSSPLQEFLHIIRGTKINNSDSTIKDCKNMALDLAKTLIFFNQKINAHMSRISNIKYNLKHESININDEKNINEYSRLLNELYAATILPIFQRLRDIEALYNKLSNNSIDKVLNMVSLDNESNIIKSVPDTTRMPLNLMDLYSLPSFESYQMYDEYLKSLPMFSDDLYFSEAFDMSTVMNVIQSLLDGAWKTLESWYLNSKVKAAMSWVRNNEKKIRNTNLEPAIESKIKIFPYPSLNNRSLELDKGYKNLINNIKNFHPEDANFNVDKYIISLYPSETVKKWFDEDENKGKQKYWTWIISNCGENEVPDEPMKEIELNTTNISKLQKECLENCIAVEKIFNSLKSTKNNLDQSFKTIKQSVVSLSNKSDQTSSVGAANNNENKDDNKQNSDQKNGNNIDKSNPINNANSVLAQIRLAIQRLWYPIPKLTSTVITDQYQHIKMAYEASIGNNQENK